jgi:hypothetical protein
MLILCPQGGSIRRILLPATLAVAPQLAGQEWVPPFAQFAVESGRGTVYWGFQLARPELSKQRVKARAAI